MPELDPALPRPMHPDVDPDSWSEFEHRIQARRFEALLRTSRDALSGGNLALAEHALNEARQIHQDSPAIARLSAEIASRNTGAERREFTRRSATAVAMLVLGAGMLVGLDMLRGARSIVPTATLSSATADDASTTGPLQGDTSSAVTHLRFAAAVDERRPSLFDSDTVVRERPAALASERLAKTADAERTRSSPSSLLSPSSSGEAIAPTTVAITPRHPLLAELDADVPGASVASLLSDAAARVAATSDSSGAATELRKVATVLHGYAEAYAAHDVNATRELWPDANERELSRAFETSLSRYVSFDACDITVQGGTATASCRGQASYAQTADVTPAPREARSWRLDLRRVGDAWKIENAASTR